MSDIITFRIDRLAALGDGVGQWQGRPVFVPLTLPGDIVTARIVARQRDHDRAELVSIDEGGTDRRHAPCIHFGDCGGCELQHLSTDAYRRFKRGIALQVAARLGGDEAQVAPLVEVPPHSRRRVEVKVTVNKGAVSLGFLAARSHRVVDVVECPVADPAIAANLALWRAQIATLKTPGNIKAIHLTQVEGGLDVILHTATRSKPHDRDALISFAREHDILRLSERVGDIAEQTILHRVPATVTVDLGGVPVELPAGAFLQATRPSQEALVALVREACQGHDRIIDLYCGCGTFSFPLLKEGHTVQGYEGDADMTNAALNAARRVGLDGPARFSARDLFASPLQPSELRGYDAAVINPPRNGALPQVKALAEAKVARIVMVSCNPATCERDAAWLLGNGYRMDRLVPVDQFLWSHHLELVAIFTRL